MSEFFKRKYRALAIFASLILVVTLVAGVVAFQADTLPAMAVQGGKTMAKIMPSGAPEGFSAPIKATEFFENMTTFEIEKPIEIEPVYNFPANMRGVFLTPGVDYLVGVGGQAGEAAVKAQVDNAIANAKSLTMNSLILVTDYNDKVIYHTTDAPAWSDSFDVMEYAVKRLREENMYAYAVFNTEHYDVDATNLPIPKSAGAGAINQLSANMSEFAEKYQLDGIMLDGYTNRNTGRSYKVYTLLGGGAGYENYMRHMPKVVLTTAANAVRRTAPNTQLGLLLDSVWANADEDEQGSATRAVFTALVDGNTDTKALVESGMFQFAAVKAYGSLTSQAEPFGVVAKWWASVASAAELPLYVVQASSRACTEYDGWAAHDQLTKQAIELEGISGVRGTMFNSLARLVEDPKEATTTLIKYYNQEIQAAHILTELAVTKPERNTFTTTEMTVTFTGASDPNSLVTINGETITTDASGYFTLQKDLQGGENRFNIFHKEKTVTYNITRLVEIVKDVMPQGTLRADGSMDITITALAYHDAQVSAYINNTSIPMQIDESMVDEASRDSNYKLFVGVYTAPPATANEQNLGAISVTGSWQGETKTLSGATVIINRRARIEDGVPIVVVADQAKTYPANTLDNIPSNTHYPLPKGAMDYAVGDEITYVVAGTTYKYFVLASGLRVESKDIRAVDDYASGNVIESFTLKVENGFTYVTLPMAQQVSYTFQYKGDNVVVVFHNTVRSPASKELAENPLFTNAVWSNNNTLELKMVRTGGFMGYKGYYEDGKLVLRFNNPPSSIRSARIAIDPGHGGRDTGALGFLRDYPERAINWSIANYLKNELESRGATVLLINTSGGMTLSERVVRAEQFNADMFISVHNNSARNASAVGTETYYFYPFSYALARNSAAQVASQLSTTNRGARQSYYHVTLSSQFQSVLVECGFVSNKNEYEKLIRTSYQKSIATGIADSISAAISASYTGISGGTTTTTEGDTPRPEVVVGNNAVEGVSANKSSLTLKVGDTDTLKAEIEPANAADKAVSWDSSNSAVATVDRNGKVTAIAEGTADITVTTNEGGHTDTIRVTVSGKGSGEVTTPVNEIFFNPEKYTLAPRKTLMLTVNSDIGPLKASDFKWESSDETLATVSQDGIVTAKAKSGEVTIYVEGFDLGAFCDINITDESVAVMSVELSETSITMIEGTSWSGLNVDIYPENASEQEIKWSGSNNRVSVNGNTVSARSSGEVILTAKVGAQAAELEVEIIKTSDLELEINADSLEMYVGDIDTLEAWLDYDVVGDNLFVWSSNNTDVISVDEKGNIKALNSGTAIVTCKLRANTKIMAECEIIVG